MQKLKWFLLFLLVGEVLLLKGWEMGKLLFRKETCVNLEKVCSFLETCFPSSSHFFFFYSGRKGFLHLSLRMAGVELSSLLSLFLSFEFR
jgi:hypothetical protein